MGGISHRLRSERVHTNVNAARRSACATLFGLCCGLRDRRGVSHRHSSRRRWRRLLRHAIALHQSGNVAAAIPEYRAYLKQVPGNVMARSNLGAALSRAGLYAEAIAEYKKALESQPGNAPVRLNLALAYYKAAEISQAAAELARVVAEQPSNRQAIFLLADCDLRLGRE